MRSVRHPPFAPPDRLPCFDGHSLEGAKFLEKLKRGVSVNMGDVEKSGVERLGSTDCQWRAVVEVNERL
jgi:hypothetical protein